MHYVLAFDRDVVAESLSKECHTDGTRYLEKIVQAPFELPRPRSDALHGWFAHQLESLVERTDSAFLDASHWNEVFFYGISPFLRTPRDVTRLANTLAVTYPALENEVNVVDFVAVETLRVFEPKAYDVIRSNEQRFTGLHVAARHLHEANVAFHAAWLTGSAKNPEAVRSLIARLFPDLLDDSAGRVSRDDLKLRRARRICVAQMFPVYFRYAFDSGLSRENVLSCFELRGEELSAELERMMSERFANGTTKIRSFLEALRDELLSGRRVAVELLAGLCGIGDRVIGSTQGRSVFDVGDDYLLVFIVEKIVEAMPKEERASALTAALNGAGISTSAMVVTILGAQHGRHGEPPHALSERTLQSGAEIDALEAAVRRRIEDAAAPRTLRRAMGGARGYGVSSSIGNGSEGEPKCERRSRRGPRPL